MTQWNRTTSSFRTGSRHRSFLLLHFVFLLLFVYHLSWCTAILDQPFTTQSFTSLRHAPCVSLFYRLGRLGCSTEEHDTVQIGKLIYYNGAIPDVNDPTNYVSLVEDYNMITATIENLKSDYVNTGRLQGILVLNSTSLNTGNSIYSPDTTYVQGYNTPSSQINYGGSVQYKWNSRGQGLTNYDLHGIPIAYIMDSFVSQELRMEGQTSSSASSSTNNKATKNAIVAEFNYYMGPETMDSITCLTWHDVSNQQWKPKCLPLGGLSVWAHVGSPPNDQNQKPIVLLSAGMDATNLYHDLSYGSNTAASNIIAIIMASKLLGSALTDVQYDALPNRIVLSLFQGESYGFIGSRRFLRDIAYPGFTCNSEVVRSNIQLGDISEYGCLNPLRQNLRFMNLGNQISSMLSIDQIGHAVANGILYVHGGDDDSSAIVNFLKNVGTNQFSVAASSAVDTGYGYPFPPSPYTSLLSLSGGAVSGAVLTGYDYDFPSKLPYHSQKDVPDYIELKTIAATATIIARTVLAAAYDDGTYSGQGDYSTPTTYAKNFIPELSYSDSTLVEVANCFLRDGNCNLIQKYTKTESTNQGVDIGEALGTPPNYYVGTYSWGRGQPYVQVGENIYGAYNGSDYGSKKSDAIVMQPKQLESTIYGLFNDFLGRGSTSSSSESTSCKKVSDCVNVENLCKNNAYDTATCSGSGICICVRAQYHIALDEAIRSVEQMSPNYFAVDSDNDAGVTPMYTEPYWSSSVGVRIYRNANVFPGYISLIAGVGIGAVSFFGALVLKVGLKKEKLY